MSYFFTRVILHTWITWIIAQSFFCLTSSYSYREFWHLASYTDKYPYRIRADMTSLIIFVWKFINGYCCCRVAGNCMPQAKTSGKIINTTFIIGGNIKTKNGWLKVASLACYYTLYHITPPVTRRALLELMLTSLLGLLSAALSVQLGCVSVWLYQRRGRICAIC